MIPTRTLWKNGPEVGSVGLGCMGMTWAYKADEQSETPDHVIGHALDIGVNFIDTADVYGPFTNEEVVGKALGSRRSEVTLATKGGLVSHVGDAGEPIISGPNGHPEHLRTAIDDSLRRLGVDHVDLYYLHRPDPKVPVEDSIGAMSEMVEAGKVGALGVSEFTVEQLDRAQAIHPISAVQSELSLWTREHLATSLAWTVANDAAFVPFSPLGRGFLTGTFRGTAPAADDFRSQLPRFNQENRDANLVIVDAIAAVAAELDATPAQVALAWVLAQGENVVPIPGTRRTSRLDENAGAASVSLSAGQLATLDALPPPAGSR
ncbi:aldo/keto reductase [Rhodococcus sp. G-MC3]|uniref:aldo/keto reductase n=1 Tax=Rhodococcus sp. G-MC3 TaxID=3046209 RepID=UPI0024B8AEC9|nr:aldo/keto reductase [Rhodococcus sp. G-MC3]MDJ0394382.1 aldo/keto reductase [Rhodococcus sp. G-MC3]